jgi:hypothetical protein
MTQKEQILEYLEKNGTITTLECMQKLGVLDLQRPIMLLRNEGYNITDRWIKKMDRLGRKTKYKEYRLEK